MEARARHRLELRRLAGGPHFVKIGLYRGFRTRQAVAQSEIPLSGH